ncbi:MAG TPA: hypothetical protein VLZ84_07125 [Asticcacaulis sp.]|nr:hypothetical protein [Asticcacaulis sp.]
MDNDSKVGEDNPDHPGWVLDDAISKHERDFPPVNYPTPKAIRNLTVAALIHEIGQLLDAARTNNEEGITILLGSPMEGKIIGVMKREAKKRREARAAKAAEMDATA